MASLTFTATAAGLLSGGGGGGLPNIQALLGGALQLILGFATGGGIPPLAQAMPFNLGNLASMSASTSTSNTNAITGLADSMLSHLANNQPSVVSTVSFSVRSVESQQHQQQPQHAAVLSAHHTMIVRIETCMEDQTLCVRVQNMHFTADLQLLAAGGGLAVERDAAQPRQHGGVRRAGLQHGVHLCGGRRQGAARAARPVSPGAPKLAPCLRTALQG